MHILILGHIDGLPLSILRIWPSDIKEALLQMRLRTEWLQVLKLGP